MKKLIPLFIILLFVIVPIALAAQDNPQPDNELVLSGTALIAALGALVSNFIITFLKTIPYLGEPDKDKLAQAVTEVVSVLVGLATGWFIAWVTQQLGLISDSNTQVLVISILTPVLNELRYRLAKLAPVKQ